MDTQTPPPPQPILTTGGRTVLSTTALINQRKSISAHKHRHSTAHLQALGALRSILIPPKEDTLPPTPPTLSPPPNKQEPASNKDIKDPSYTEKQYEIAKLAAKHAGRKRVEEVDLDFARRFEEVLMGWAKRLEDHGSP